MDCKGHRLMLNSPKLRRVLAHWCEARGGRLIPGWRDIDPAKIKTELQIVWSYRYDAIQDEFVGVLAGDAIHRLLGGSIKNARFRQLHEADPHFFNRAKRVLFDPAIYIGRGLLFRQRNRQCYGERIILPLWSDGCAESIFGATDYKFSFPRYPEADADNELEQWWDLEAPTDDLLVKSLEPAI
jgi:hypothetical protein